MSSELITGISLARQFHELYEELAPLYGYETRVDTKEFDPNSNNGRLMAEVCRQMRDRILAQKPGAGQA